MTHLSPSCQPRCHLMLSFWCLEKFVTALLLAGNHPAHIYVVLGKDLPCRLNGGIRQSSCSTQDPGKVNVEEPQNIRTGVHHGCVHVVSGEDPVRGIWQDCNVKEQKTKFKSPTNVLSWAETGWESNLFKMRFIKLIKQHTAVIRMSHSP